MIFLEVEKNRRKWGCEKKKKKKKNKEFKVEKCEKRGLKCMLIKLACVVAMHMSRSITIWFSLLYWTILSFMASNIWNCMSFWILLCKSYHVKFTTVTLIVNILSWSYAKSIHFTFLRFLKLGLLSLHYFYTYSYNEQSFERNLCVLFLRVYDLWDLNQDCWLLLWDA